jgi:hypothetical protein
MTKPMITIHNAETGEIIEREMNAKEIVQHEADQTAYADRVAQEAAKEAAKAALLAKLGITEDEAKLLLS